MGDHRARRRPGDRRAREAWGDADHPPRVYAGVPRVLRVSCRRARRSRSRRCSGAGCAIRWIGSTAPGTCPRRRRGWCRRRRSSGSTRSSTFCVSGWRRRGRGRRRRVTMRCSAPCITPGCGRRRQPRWRSGTCISTADRSGSCTCGWGRARAGRARDRGGYRCSTSSMSCCAGISPRRARCFGRKGRCCSAISRAG